MRRLIERATEILCDRTQVENERQARDAVRLSRRGFVGAALAVAATPVVGRAYSIPPAPEIPPAHPYHPVVSASAVALSLGLLSAYMLAGKSPFFSAAPMRWVGGER